MEEKMKAKSGKIIKICALSLSLLLVGGVAASPIAKAYAQEPAGPEVRKNKKRIVIHYPRKNSGFKVYWWTETEQKTAVQDKNWADLVDDPTKDEATATIDLAYEDKEIKLGYIVAKQDWSERDIKDKGNQDQRYVDLDDTTNEVILTAGDFNNVTKKYNPAIKHPDLKIADTVGDKLKPYIKDLKVWYGEDIDWEKALDKTSAANDDNVKNFLENISVENASYRNNTTTTKQEGDIKVTFKDGSSLKFKNTLYVTHEVTAATNQNAPEDAIDIELKLGTGVKDGAGNEGSRSFGKYKAKPGIDVSKAQIAGSGSIFQSNISPTDPNQKLKWLNKDKKENYEQQ